MSVIANSMWIWLISSIALMVVLLFYQSRKWDGNDSLEFSNITMFFNPVKGEGDIFLGGILVLVFFSFFLFELAKVFRSMLF